MAKTPSSQRSISFVDRYDWLILNALSDDYESVEQIVQLVNAFEEMWPDVTQLEVINRLERLYQAGHVFLTLGAKFDRDAMIREIDQSRDRKFWFGRTSSGDTLWHQYSAQYYPE